MPRPLNVSEFSSTERDSISRALHLTERGAQRVELRGEVNARYGDHDLLDEVMSRIALHPGDIVVDVGCGSGAHLERYAHRVAPRGAALGVDFDEGAVAAARARRLHVELASAHALPFEAATADALTCNYAIYYFPDLDRCVSEMRRVCKPAAHVALTGPATDTNEELFTFHERATGSRASDADRMALGFVAKEGRLAIARAGFTAVEVDEFVNRVTFPDVTAFLDYWTATSLFLRTPGATREMGRQALPPGTAPPTITKRTNILVARR